MGTLYCDTGGSATNSGSTDQNSANLSGSAASVAGSVVTLDGSPDLTGIVTSGATQSSIYISQATNSNQKIFWITAADNALKTVTVSVAPTGVTSSAWAIGGRFVLTNASQEGAPRAGDTVIFNNSPASQAGTSWTFRASGDVTSGYITIKGKLGVRPVLATSGSANACVVTSTNVLCWVENLEITQTHASNGIGVNFGGAGCVAYNVKVSDAGTNGMAIGAAMAKIIACEITGAAGDGINLTAGAFIFGTYIHDNTGDGIEYSATSGIMSLNNTIIDTNGGRGIFLSGAWASAYTGNVSLVNCVVYNNGNSGIEVSDADAPVTMINNIFQNNGDAAGEFNAEWTAGSAEMATFHAWNVFNTAAAGGSGNVSGLTVNAQVASSEITTDPAMANPGSADFSITNTSGAFATGFPGQFLGANLGRKNMGALENNSAAASGGPVSLVNGGGLVG